MSTRETIAEDARQERIAEAEARAAADVPVDCICELNQWVLMETTTYGEDADGNRGVPLRLYQCSACSDECEVIG